MPIGSSSKSYLLFLLAGLSLSVLPAWADVSRQVDARDMLSHMSSSIHKHNYDGIFVYSHNGRIDTMRIVHKTVGGMEKERLVSLSGSAREVIRDNDSVTCILPDDRAVMVDTSRPKKLFPVLLTESVEKIAVYYQISADEDTRIANRAARVINVLPKDSYRYGYRLGLDGSTGLLLSSQLLGQDHSVLEQIIFTDISIDGDIDDRHLEPSISGEGYKRMVSRREGRPQTDNSHNWHVGWLPEGFMMRDHELDPIPTSKMPVEHLVYSDGLASVSVFIEEIEKAEDRLEGISSMGAMSAYGAMIGKYQVTVVGEVPPKTVRLIGESVRQQAAR